MIDPVHVYNGAGNTVELQLAESGKPLNLGMVDRITLRLGTSSSVIDSAITPQAFDWSTDSGKLVLRLGDLGLAPGRYTVRMVVYSGGNSEGIIWGGFPMIVSG